MKTASQKLIMIAVLMAVGVLALTLVFHGAYEPQLALRVQQHKQAPDPRELDRLIRLALEDRLDLTDTLQFAALLARQGRVDDELALFKRLKARYPSSPPIRLWTAERLQQYGQWVEADSEYLALIAFLQQPQVASQRREPHVWRARDKDIAAAQRAVDIPGHQVAVPVDEIYRKLAENAMAAGQAAEGASRRQWLDKSQEYFALCLAINPDNVDTRGAYANLLLLIGRPADSLSHYQILLRTEPRNLGWLYSAALAAGADRQFGLAEHYVRTALSLENRPEWHLDLARFMSWGGKHDAALGEIDALIEQYPASLDYRRERADLLLNARRHREYLEETMRLAATHPLDLALRLNRIRAMIGVGMYPEAVQEAAALLALDPRHREAALLKAEALLWMGNYRAAQSDLRDLAQQLPEDRAVTMRLAQSYLWDKRYDEALAGFRRLNPAALDDVEVAQGFAEAVSGKKLPGTEDAAMIRALRLELVRRANVNWPVPLLTALARALREIGEKEAAVELLSAATQRAESNLKLRLELADLLQDVGRREEADRQYRLITNTGTKDAPP